MDIRSTDPVGDDATALSPAGPAAGRTPLQRVWTPAWLARRPRPVRIALRTLVLLLLALFLAWLILFITKGRFLKHRFERIAGSVLERQVKVGGDFQLYLAPFNIKFVAEDMTISNPDWARARNFFSAKRIDTRIRVIPLIFGKREMKTLLLDQGQVALEWDKQHKRNTWTFGDPNKKGEPMTIPSIERGLLARTHLDYRDPRMTLVTAVDFETLKATDTRFANDIRFTGTGSMRAKPFRFKGRLLSPNATIAGGSNRLTVHGWADRTSVDIAGTLPGATQLKGSDLKLKVRGYNLASLFDYLGVAIPETRSYRMASDLTYDGEWWRFTALKGVFGSSDLAGSFRVGQPDERLKIIADLSTRSLDLIDVGPFIGYNPEKLDAQGAKAAVEKVKGVPRILPDSPLRIDAISRFDADVRYRVAQIRNHNFPVSDIDVTVGLDRSLLTLKPLTANVASGKLTAGISVDARGKAVVTAYDIRLSPTPMGKLLARFGVDQAGTSGTLSARIQMKGTGDSLRQSLATSNGRIAIIIPNGKFWTRNVQLAELDLGTFVQKMFQNKLKKPVEINCGLIGFTVRDGIAAADPILIDTTKNVIVGRGGFSFRNEGIDMGVRADAKTFSVFSAQSPIGVGGHFAEPKINAISGELLARVGAGLGASLLATPVAGLIAFVDPGDAKSTACGPVLSGARASQQRTTKGEKRKDVGNGTPSKGKL
ncbi:hypothetical protein WSK_0291 [Novosphingobium sp. Rr 2-17]|uniref:AsmA family protein n=1 Tax=Novosphingobium sp. Rr 2-17 TaxID=555793 RepID=UPI0002698B47|nr:AsmA family protein [Novosphingobium sp. Rr 2-17]EIZ81139.1 hypothetical protein WSK_0291 [Novosphingobium sp. Rr 2-17]